MRESSLILLLIAILAIIAIYCYDYFSKSKPDFADASLIRKVSNPIFWAKAKIIASEAERIADNYKQNIMPNDEQEFLGSIVALWKIWSAKLHGERLEVQIQSFLLRPDMSAMLTEAEAGIMPLKPHELLTAVFACVLLSGTHSKAQLEEAVQRLEERAAERK
jgi:hypothetical protein